MGQWGLDIPRAKGARDSTRRIQCPHPTEGSPAALEPAQWTPTVYTLRSGQSAWSKPVRPRDPDLSGLGAWNPLLTLSQGTAHSPLRCAPGVALGDEGKCSFPSQ